MRKEWAREYYTLVTCHFFVQSFSNSSDSFTVKRIKKHSFLVIDIFLFLHNLFVNKFFFPGTTPKQSQMIIILQAKKGKASLRESLLKPARLFLACQGIYFVWAIYNHSRFLTCVHSLIMKQKGQNKSAVATT